MWNTVQYSLLAISRPFSIWTNWFIKLPHNSNSAPDDLCPKSAQPLASTPSERVGNRQTSNQVVHSSAILPLNFPFRVTEWCSLQTLLLIGVPRSDSLVGQASRSTAICFCSFILYLSSRVDVQSRRASAIGGRFRQEIRKVFRRNRKR